MSSEQELYAEAALGRQVEGFFQGDLGRYLLGCADQEIESAMDELKHVHPWRSRKIRDLQNKIYRAESFKVWLSELIIRGQQALATLETTE